jgi:hypothetical protein
MKLLDYVVSLATGTGQNAVAVSAKMSDDSLVGQSIPQARTRADVDAYE